LIAGYAVRVAQVYRPGRYGNHRAAHERDMRRLDLQEMVCGHGQQ